MLFTNPIGDGALPEVKGREEVDFERSHPLVPQLPFLYNMIGPTGSGKTTALVKLLITEGAWLHKFHRILYFVPTIHVDKNWALVQVKGDHVVFTDWNNETLLRLKDKLIEEADKNLAAGRKQPATLLILDDTAGLQRSSGTMSPIDVMYAICRKINLSIVNCVQKWTGNLNVATRNNATHTSIFKLQSRDELTKVMKDLCPPDLSEKQFLQMYLDAVGSGLGGFFHISRFSPVGSRFSAQFHKVYAL